MAINSPIRITGFSGTLDTDSLITKLMQAERAPLNKIQKSKQFTLWQREDYQTMNKALLSFRNTVNNLRFDSSFEQTKSSSSNSSVVEVQSSSTSAVTSSIKVERLASAATIISGTISSVTDKVGKSGSVEINGVPISFTADSTVESIIKDINNRSSTTGVKANFDKSSKVLYLSSTALGNGAKVDVTGNANELNDFLSILNLPKSSETGQNAKYYVNGSTTAIESSSNTISVNGVQVALRSIGEASIGVVTDRSGIVDKIKEFVAEYNSLIDIFSTAATTKKSRDYEPLTAEEKEAMSESQVTQWEKKARQGTLYNDSLLKDTLNYMRTSLNTPLNVQTGQIQMLSNIGITVMSDWKENGKLQIDETKLQEAVNTRFDEVKELFLKSSDEISPAGKTNYGVADRLYEIVNNQMGKFTKKIGSGSIETLDESVLGKQLRYLSDQESDWKVKLQDIETRYYKRFAAMESALQKMNSQSSWLSSQLG